MRDRDVVPYRSADAWVGADGALDAAAVSRATESVFADETTRLVADVAWNAGLRIALLDHQVLREGEQDAHVFSHELQPRMKAADQTFTGLCWAFAGLGILRRHLAATLRLPPDFELSQSYVLFYDKLEKANAFLHYRWLTRDCAPDDRRLLHLLDRPVEDGGGFHNFARLVAKYGVVPAAAMPRGQAADSTHVLNRHLRTLLLKSAARLARARDEAEARRERAHALSRVHRLLCICLGTPPSVVKWSFRSTGEGADEGAGGLTTVDRMSPVDFYRRHCPDVSSFVNLVHVPHRVEPTPHAYEVEFLDSVVDARGPTRFVAVDARTFREAAIAALRKGVPVWFACEFDQLRLQGLGLLHHDLVRHERAILEPQDGADKRARILQRRCRPDHAMLLTGLHEDPETGEVVRFQVENSHGAENKEGYLSMTVEWFDRHVLGLAVPSGAVPAAPVTRLPPWDILGLVATTSS